MNSGLSSSPIPQSEGQRMDPTGSRLAIIFVRLQRIDLTRDAFITESPNFMNLGLSSNHTSDEFGSIFIPTTIIRRPTYGSNWLLPGHHICEVTADRVSRTRPEQNYNTQCDFETRRRGAVNQDFGRQNISISQPPLNSTTLGTNTHNRTTSPIDSIPVGTK